MSIALQGIVKVYGSGPSAVAALNGLDLEVADSEICILRGPNGSGKSTLIGILAGELTATAGTLHVSGSNGLRPRIGVVRQFDNLQPQLSVAEHFQLFGERSGLVSVPATLHGRLVRTLTKGERQLVAIALAMSRQPDVLLADEPTGALPHDEALVLYDALAQQVRDGRVTVLLVTHDARAERIADRVVNLRDGRISQEWLPGLDPQQVIDARGWMHLPDQLRSGLGQRVLAVRTDGGVTLQGQGEQAPAIALPAAPRPVSAEIVLQIEQLSCGPANNPVISGLTHAFARGSITAVTGASGSGKTTLLRALSGVLPVQSGQVRWAPDATRAPYFSIDLPFALHCTLDELIPTSALVEQLELDDFRARPLHTLSGGQRQRALVALALAHDEPLVLLDEPTTALDAHSSLLVLDAITESQKTFIIATHDHQVTAIATELLHLT